MTEVKKKLGRPKNENRGPRVKQVKLVVSDSEAKALDSLATDWNMPTSKAIRTMVDMAASLSDFYPVVVHPEFQQLLEKHIKNKQVSEPLLKEIEWRMLTLRRFAKYWRQDNSVDKKST